MNAESSNRDISTRKGLLIIAIVVAAIALISLVRHWSQADATASGVAVIGEDGHQGVAIFTTDTCTYCAAAKQFLAEKRVPFTEFNLDQSVKARQVFGMLNGRGVPLIIVGQQRLVGFDPGLLQRVLKEQGILR
ncbi:MAG: glutaredoxin family protein [Desulfosarcinaceae bacterium]|nr:glutaredoxin family protein [Desulfosarcinaceae bacterium]